MNLAVHLPGPLYPKLSMTHVPISSNLLTPSRQSVAAGAEGIVSTYRELGYLNVCQPAERGDHLWAEW